MAFGFYSLLEAALLVVNAIAILHEERFLSKEPEINSLFDFIQSNLVGWDRNSMISSASMANIPYGGGFNQDPISPQLSFRMQILNFLHSVRTVARVPLIFINILVIIFKLL
ncbi:Immediate early response 3-interacting protein 1 [Sarcoptes scabiei]|uniref:Immediate early response 3-interacting protein 1 n=1 Tax=Sarcoptes scabiei TaxID=52283 RepID=A0A834RKC5_SARSC|nr:Immediate early response 3-interacting protein 1 [Sarcoptes scabiei]